MTDRLTRREVDPHFGRILDRRVRYEADLVSRVQLVDIPIATRKHGPVHRGAETRRASFWEPWRWSNHRAQAGE